jgi:hypothetical protein
MLIRKANGIILAAQPSDEKLLKIFLLFTMSPIPLPQRLW